MDLEEQYDKIYRYCYFKVGRRELAEDITQETFLRCYERYGHYGNPWTLPYLYRIAHNLCVDEYRRPPMEELPEDIPREGLEDRVLTSLLVKGALSVLSQEEKELLLLHYVNELPLLAIGKIWGLSRFVLYRRLKKAVKKLQQELGKEGLF